MFIILCYLMHKYPAKIKSTLHQFCQNIVRQIFENLSMLFQTNIHKLKYQFQQTCFLFPQIIVEDSELRELLFKYE